MSNWSAPILLLSKFISVVGVLAAGLSLVVATFFDDRELPFMKEKSLSGFTVAQFKELEERVWMLEAADITMSGTPEPIDPKNYVEENVLLKLDSQDERLKAIERTLDTTPREVVELILLRDEVADLQKETKEQLAQVVREIDRAYTLMLAILGALLVSVVGMIISNFLQGKRQT